MSIILLLPVAISTDRSTDRPCALDMCNSSRSFTHRSNTCTIRRLAFLNIGFIEQVSRTPLPATLYNLTLLFGFAEFWFVHEPQNLEIEPNRLALRTITAFSEYLKTFQFEIWGASLLYEVARALDSRCYSRSIPPHLILQDA